MATFRYPNSKVWWYDFQFNGRRYRESTKTHSRTLARDAERARRRQLEEGFNSLSPRVTPISFTQAAEEYLSTKALTLQPRSHDIERRGVAHLKSMFGNKLLNDITAADIRKYQIDTEKNGSAPKSINLYISTLRGILRQKKLWADIQPNVRMLKVPDDIGRALSIEEEQRLLDECRKSLSRTLYVVVVMALCTGMRFSEIRLLRWKQIDFAHRILTVGKSKTRHGEGRRIPINDRLLGVLEGWKALFPNHTRDHFVFPTERVKIMKNTLLPEYCGTNPEKPYRNWKTAWWSALKRSGIEMRFHDLRHTAATNMLEAGIPYAVVAEIMGWSPSTSIIMAKRYSHIRPIARQNAVATLNGPVPDVHIHPACLSTPHVIQ